MTKSSRLNFPPVQNNNTGTLFPDAPIGIAILSGRDFKVDMVNPYWLKIFNISEEDIKDRPFSESATALKSSELLSHLEAARDSGIQFQMSEISVARNSTAPTDINFINLHIQPYLNPENALPGVMLIALDVSEQVRAKHAALKNAESLELAIETTQLGTWDFNPITGILKWSDKTKAFFGLPPEAAVTNEIFIKALHPDDRERVQAAANRAFSFGSDGEYSEEYRINSTRGLRWIKARGRAFFDEEGEAYRFIGTMIDITEKKIYEQELEQSEKRFRQLADSMPQIVWTADPTGFTDYYNKHWHDIIGDDTQLKETGSFTTYIHPDDRTKSIKTWEKAISNQSRYEMEYRLRVKGENDYRWFLARAFPIEDEEGNTVKWFGTCTDIDEVKRVEYTLRESEKRFRSVADSAPVLIWESDHENNRTFCNKGWHEFTGRLPEEEACQGWTAGIHPDDYNNCINTYRQAFESKEVFDLEYRLKRTDGEYRWIMDHGTPRFSEDGRFLGFIGSCMDVHERNKSREELENYVVERTEELRSKNEELNRQKEFVETILDSSVDLIAVWDIDERLVTINRKHMEIYGFQKENVIAKSFAEIFPGAANAGSHRDLKTALTGIPVNNPSYRSTITGRYYQNHFIPLKDEAGKTHSVVIMAHDITDLLNVSEEIKRTNSLLAERNIELERSNNELAAFSYVASHDLQEPIRKIRAFGKLVSEMERHKFSEVGKDYFDRMINAGGRMQNLIESLLEFSRTTSDKNFIPSDLNTLLNETKKEYSELIAEKNATIYSDKLPTIPVIPYQIRQLFGNLISNSIKYKKDNQDPLIRISSKYLKGSETGIPSLNKDQHYWLISFRDNGIGFNPDYADKIFELFHRLHDKTQYSGSGIGLTICKKITLNHNGFISAGSFPGDGAQFDIYLPKNSTGTSEKDTQ